MQLIEALLKPMEEHTEDARVEEEAARLPVRSSTHYSQLTTNTCLLGQNRNMG